MRLFYFGCIEVSGHFLWDHNLQSVRKSNYPFPWKMIDGCLCPQTTTEKGVAKLHHKDGWTALAFWDYSIDKRLNSNSVFFAEGIHGFYHMIQFGKKYFPKIYKRFNFELTDFILPEEKP